MFTFDDKSRQCVNSIKTDLQQISHQSIYGNLWSRVIRLIELVEAIMEKNITNIAKVYYKLQCRHTLFATDKPSEIPVFIMNDLDKKWERHLQKAIYSINEAAPGLYLYTTASKETARVIVGEDQVNTRDVDTPSTRPLNKEKGTVFIHLPKKYPSEDLLRYNEIESDDLMEGSAIHEIVHALNFKHHYQRFDADLYLSIDESLKEKQKNNFSKTCTIFNLVRHDLSSIMHTNELKGSFERIEGDPYSALKTNSRRSCKLSEGDKVALNLKYKPCRSNRYNPKVNSELGIVYCGRSVMQNHDQFSKGTTDKNCGPNNWANCHACRVILDIVNADGSLEELPTVKKCIADGRWQGISGLFYCGKTYSSPFVDILKVKRDGVCGPDVGLPCTDCGKIMYPEYSIKMNLPKRESPVQPESTTPNRDEQNPKSVTCTVS